MFHRVKNVIPLPEYVLFAHFINGEEKKYDMKSLIDHNEAFSDLRSIPGLFNLARPDVGGYGIVWNENIDIDAEEIYQNGIDVHK